jgi:hypothetical protein
MNWVGFQRDTWLRIPEDKLFITIAVRAYIFIMFCSIISLQFCAIPLALCFQLLLTSVYRNVLDPRLVAPPKKQTTKQKEMAFVSHLENNCGKNDYKRGGHAD